MTAITITDRDDTSKPSEKSNTILKRNVTDKYGLIIFIFLMVCWIGVCGYVVYLVRDPAYVSSYESEHSNIINTSYESQLYLNISTSKIEQLAVLINSTTDILNNIELFSGVRVNDVLRVSGLLMLFSFPTRLSTIISEILSKESDLEYNNHVFIISSSRLIITLIITILGVSSSESNIILLLLLCIEFCMMVFTNMAFFTSYNADNLKKTLQYYTRHRYLLLFKFLNLMFVAFLLTFNVIIWKSLGKANLGYATLISIGTLHIIFMIYKYEKMVIIAVIACHYWDEQEKTVSLKAILSTMGTVFKYHLGTIFISVLPISVALRDSTINNFKLYNRIVKNFNKPYFASHIIEHATMITAIDSRNFNEAINDAISLEAVGCLKCCGKSKPTIAWKNTSRVFSVGPAFCFVMSLTKALNAKALLCVIVAVVYYAVITALYCSIFSVIETAEHTIKFYKMKQERKEINHNSDMLEEAESAI